MSNSENNRPPQSASPDAVYRPQYEDDTISLIDLIAVVVRHRTLIIVGTVLAGILSILALYVGPRVGLEVGPQPVYTAQRRILVSPVPTDLEEYVSVEVAAAARTILQDPRMIGDIYRDFEEDPPADRTPEEYLSMIRNRLINGDTYTVDWDNNSRILTIGYTNSHSGDTNDFLDAVVSALGPSLTSQIGPRFAEAANALDASLASSRATLAELVDESVRRVSSSAVTPDAILSSLERTAGSSIATFATTQGTITRLRRIASDAGSLVSLVGSPVVYQDTSGSRSMIVIITTITVFFLTVFLAFVLEYVRRVRQEPEEMEKLQSAWERR